MTKRQVRKKEQINFFFPQDTWQVEYKWRSSATEGRKLKLKLASEEENYEEIGQFALQNPWVAHNLEEDGRRCEHRGIIYMLCFFVLFYLFCFCVVVFYKAVGISQVSLSSHSPHRLLFLSHWLFLLTGDKKLVM